MRMVQIDYFLATISPYVYLAGNRLEEIAARHGARVRYLPLNAAALFPRTGGQIRADRHPSRLAYRDQELRRQAQKRGVRLDLKPLYDGANPAPSSYAILAAQTAGEARVGQESVVRGRKSAGRSWGANQVATLVLGRVAS